VTDQPEPQFQPQPMLETDARMWAMLINLAAVIGIVLSGGTLSLVAVLVIWLIYRERSALIDFHGKQQLNAMITTVVAGVAAVIGTIVTLGIGAFVLFPALIAYGIYLLVISIIAAVAANRGEYYRIPAIIRFVK
jgi:uncharacterized Tic20 family protein